MSDAKISDETGTTEKEALPSLEELIKKYEGDDTPLGEGPYEYIITPGRLASIIHELRPIIPGVLAIIAAAAMQGHRHSMPPKVEPSLQPPRPPIMAPAPQFRHSWLATATPEIQAAIKHIEEIIGTPIIETPSHAEQPNTEIVEDADQDTSTPTRETASPVSTNPNTPTHESAPTVTQSPTPEASPTAVPTSTATATIPPRTHHPVASSTPTPEATQESAVEKLQKLTGITFQTINEALPPSMPPRRIWRR